jgi:lysozyme
MPTPHILDLYHGDTVTDWHAIKTAGILGIIHKSSQGTRSDSFYNYRRVSSKSFGFLWGAYHFADDSPVRSQVDAFLTFAQPDSSTLLCLDYEPNGSHTMDIISCKLFLSMVHDRIGRYPILYSGNLIKETISSHEEFFHPIRLWLAQYGPKPVVPAPWSTPWLWQYTGDGDGPTPHRVQGFTGNADLSTFLGTPEDLKSSWAS